ncbi:MAG: sigma-54 dependent transcriptional regulator [Calditrichota bacterium]
MSKAKILIVDDEKLIRWSLAKNLEQNDYQVETAESGEEGLVKFDALAPDIVIIDHKLPGADGLDILTEIKRRDSRCIALFMTAFGTIETAVEAMKRGAYDYINKPFVFEEIAQLLEKALYLQGLDGEVQRLKAVVKKQFDTDNVVAASPALREILALVDKIARSEAPTVLLTGESGAGKDLIARLLHQRSPRRYKPFVTINCSSLPETLLESELFGHEKGAFTDAKALKRGQFELAAGGVVYLDEIGEVSPTIQVKLLQVIENRCFRRVGGVNNTEIDSLIIAATNINLSQAVETGRFRRDLFYRLNLIPIHVPPLRERREDIIPIALYFLRRFNEDFHRHFTGINENVRGALTNYDWPGNIRELRNVIERIVILENEEIIGLEHLPGEILAAANIARPLVPIPTPQVVSLTAPEPGLSLEAMERELVTKALHKVNFNQTKAARLLEITRDSLRYKMKKFGLL